MGAVSVLLLAVTVASLLWPWLEWLRRTANNRFRRLRPSSISSSSSSSSSGSSTDSSATPAVVQRDDDKHAARTREENRWQLKTKEEKADTRSSRRSEPMSSVRFTNPRHVGPAANSKAESSSEGDGNSQGVGGNGISISISDQDTNDDSTNDELASLSDMKQWNIKCLCQDDGGGAGTSLASFLPPGLLQDHVRSAEGVLRMGAGGCYHKNNNSGSGRKKLP